jgi:hypothetical protein
MYLRLSPILNKIKFNFENKVSLSLKMSKIEIAIMNTIGNHREKNGFESSMFSTNTNKKLVAEK